MSVACWCMLVAGILPYVTVGIAKANSPYDNADPRRADLYKGLAARAHGAHHNGFEAFPFFAIAILVASHGSPTSGTALLDGLAMAWIALRLAYIGLYLQNMASPRSAIWSIGLVVNVVIFTMPAWHG